MLLWMHQISNLQFGRATFDLGFLTSCQMNPVFQFCFGDSDQITGRLCKTSKVIDGFGDLSCSCVVFFFPTFSSIPFMKGNNFCSCLLLWMKKSFQMVSSLKESAQKAQLNMDLYGSCIQKGQRGVRWSEKLTRLSRPSPNKSIPPDCCTGVCEVGCGGYICC